MGKSPPSLTNGKCFLSSKLSWSARSIVNESFLIAGVLYRVKWLPCGAPGKLIRFSAFALSDLETFAMVFGEIWM